MFVYFYSLDLDPDQSNIFTDHMTFVDRTFFFFLHQKSGLARLILSG